ncbi:GntR family transcriptional regulator [Leifsonia aquatica]|uniref:GntR family transcriptional regulator n=1 Tax=Leifsonia aquatica TaxID=144185 RepID=UPI00381B4FD6
MTGQLVKRNNVTTTSPLHLEEFSMKVDLEQGRGGPPMYLQLANALQAFIADEQLQPGDLLPSENTLASENHLSRATVIKAFDTLIERGLISRRQGRGTFVNARPMERQLPDFTSFSEHVHGLGLAPGSELLSFERYEPHAAGRPDSPFADDLTVVSVERLRLVDGVPVGIHRALVPADVADLISMGEREAARPGFSFYEALKANEIYLASGEETLRAINANAADAAVLNVDEGTALIEIVRDSRDTTGRLVEVVRARYLGSQYLYHITFAPSTPGVNHEEQDSTDSFPRSGGGLAAAAQRMRR